MWLALRDKGQTNLQLAATLQQMLLTAWFLIAVRLSTAWLEDAAGLMGSLCLQLDAYVP